MIYSLIIFIVTLIIGVPIAFIFGVISTYTLVLMQSIPLEIIPQRLFSAIDSFPLLAVPLFILAGRIMSTGGIARRIFDFTLAIIGHFRGGLGYVNVVVSMFFAGMSGAAIADAAGLGTIEIPVMVEEGYDIEFASAITAASATVGPVIPPSIPMIIFGWLGNVSITKLFLGGIIPGILMGMSMMIYVYFISRKRNYPKRDISNLREVVKHFFKSILALLTPIIIMGGLLGGVFTATEAASVAAVYAFIVAVFVYRDLTFKELPEILIETAVDTGAVLLILGMASIFSWLLTIHQIPAHLEKFILGSGFSKVTILLALNIMLLIVGMFLNTTSALVMFTPLILVIGAAIGMSPIQIGVITVINLCIGMLTPPVGVVLFVTARVADISVTKLIKEVNPILIFLLAVLALVTYFPAVTMYIPELI
ncbi:TRAP transporter large permease [Thermodesulfobacteriota bacterium]